MIWTVNYKTGGASKPLPYRRWVGLVVLVLLVAAAAGLAYLYFWQYTGEVFPIVKFEDQLREVCANPRLPPLEYRGAQSFFEYLNKVDDEHCYSWVEFGGEKIPVPSQSETQCVDEVRKTKYICFNEEYKMTHDPCLVYSFGKDVDNQFERDMQMFSCEVHAFDHERVTEAEHVQRSEFWKEHAWNIAQFPYDKPEGEGRIQRRRSLDYIASSLGHSGREIKYLKSDLEGREWILLKEVISNLHKLDIQQIGVRLHIPITVNEMSGEARHQYFAKLFQVFQGLQCAGYKYVLGRAIRYYKGSIKIPETENKVFYPAYEVNWAKVL
ncbi:uncharacterized protein LOC121858451 [Homarus americanus]|uniref:Methyltransferase-like protein 24-like 1 n=1 Tax=Homarus americanus TaxID=6706 RepID=A0A8J5TIY2_HOMAM|nr:uncharacterized protein LOC121858451 [Homarus americanus]KAG7175425.1 Methyltransferase-like protein 24-like 1 [Homarus americanus]